MNRRTMLKGRNPQRRGIALVTVLAILTLAAILIMAFFSVSQTELTSSTTYSRGIEAQQLSKTAVDLVMHQIRTATSDNKFTWASQPGMLRTWDESGFARAFKLYSDETMVVTNKNQIFQDTEQLQDWDQESMRGIYVDLNEPVIREKDGEKHYYFPIIDPRAHDVKNPDRSTYVDPNRPGGVTNPYQTVEGFQYTTTGSWDGQLTSKFPESYPATTPVGRGPSGKGLPMPVKWIYQLEDGTLGTLDNSRRFIPLSGNGVPSRDNPMVARLAFWADDETAKINVNTAAGGRAWDTPRAGGLTDRDYGIHQPMQREYQRYPAHPATTQLSPVLFPYRLKFGQSGYDVEAVEKIYDLVPRVVGGGTKGGSEDFRQIFTGRKFELLPLMPDRDRLYATIDEFIFEAPELVFDQKTGAITNRRLTMPREEHDFQGVSWGKLNSEFLDKVKFFLTVNSRAPETTVFNTPRISMWPSHYGNPVKRVSDRDYYSAFDLRIRYCAELGRSTSSDPEAEKAQYHIQRKDSENRRADYEDIPRNQEIFGYMKWLTEQRFPGIGKTFQSKFAKYHSDECDQILTEVFDYIRSLNLYDDSLLSENKIAQGTYTKGSYGYLPWTQNRSDHKSYTNYRVDFSSGSHVGHYQMPGHGQVAPLEIAQGSKITKGFGRFPGLMETGIAFICCAEDDGNMGGPGRRLIVGDNSLAGAKWRFEDNAVRYYSNLAPLSSTTSVHLASVYGSYNVPPDPTCPAAGAEPDMPGDPAWWDNTPRGQWCKQLVTNSARWNKTLETDQPMKNEERRVQPIILFQLFSPSYGWTAMKADFRMRVRVEGDWTLKGSGTSGTAHDMELTGDYVYRTAFSPYFEMHGGRDKGGVIEPRGFLMGQGENPGNVTGRNQKKYTWIPRYAAWNSDGSDSLLLKDNPARSWGGARQPVDDPDGSVVSYPFVGKPVTVDVSPGNEKMTFSGGTLTIYLYPGGGFGSDASSNSDFPIDTSGSDESNPNMNDQDYTQKAVIEMDQTTMPVPRLRDGTFGRTEGNPTKYFVANTETQAPEYWTFHREGCMSEFNAGRMTRAISWEGDGPFINDQDVTRSYVIGHGDYRLVAAQREVGSSPSLNQFIKHPNYDDSTVRIASNFARTTTDSGYGRPANKKTLVAGINPGGRYPHLPDSFKNDFQKWGDFDNTVAIEMDGAFINKPDEGNTLGVDINDYNPWPQWGSIARPHVPYFNESWLQEAAGAAFWSPNRIVPGPGMMGSLPTGVKSNRPWQTLLFRPLQRDGKGTYATETHPGYEDPKDHYFLDFFWMPVVEPWSISEPLSTAGKININYQIQPFTYIDRSCGVRAVMGSEEMLTVPNNQSHAYKQGWGYGTGYDSYNHIGGSLRDVSLRSWINAEQTLRQFGKKFNQDRELFRAASELCEMWLVPISVKGLNMTPSLEETMRFVWDPKHPSGLGMVGDNSRERPYTNMVARFTTKSNTFQVHYRAQVIRQSMMSPADPGQRRVDAEYAVFDPSVDTVVGEYRGASIIERFVDPEDERIPDYAATYATNPGADIEPLDVYYRFRVVSSKRFSP